MAEWPQTHERDEWGEWQPPEGYQPPPLWDWPPKPKKILRWVFGWPGYLWPWNFVVFGVFVLPTWFFLTPSLETMKSFEIWWIAVVFARNLALIIIVVSLWHLPLYFKKRQGANYKYSNRWLSRDDPNFLFKNQVLDNMFWTIASAVPIWTGFEVLMLWGYANDFLPYADPTNPLFFIAVWVLIPLWREFHFYLTHRLIHWPPLYRHVHSLHHKNANPGPWSGLAMHPVEHLIYLSSVLVHCIVPSHPLHVIFHLQHLVFAPAYAHSGFHELELGGKSKVNSDNFFHYLHHKYFEVNYGGDGSIAFDRWFGTMHDGSPERHKAMLDRLRKRAKQA